MKKKRMVTALLTTAMVFGAVPTAFATDNITVTVDGQKVSFGDQQPVNINGRVMVPVRAVAEKMGWDVSFEKYSPNDSPVVKLDSFDVEYVPVVHSLPENAVA